LTRLDPILEQLLASYQFARRANWFFVRRTKKKSITEPKNGHCRSICV
jgi:hypothetical protein